MYADQKAVYAFHRAFDLPHPDHPTLEELTPVRWDLIAEEVEELRQAEAAGDMIAVIDALGDIMYVVAGYAVTIGVDMSHFFKAIHDNNMTKLGPDGKPIYREDGKVLKPDTYKPVDLRSVYKKVYPNG